ANTARVIGFSVGIHFGYADFLNGPAHEWMGAVTFAWGFSLLLLLARLLQGRFQPHPAAASNSSPQYEDTVKAVIHERLPRALLIIALAALPAAGISALAPRTALTSDQTPRIVDLPPDPSGWVSENLLSPEVTADLAQIYGSSELALRAYNPVSIGLWSEDSGRTDDSVFLFRAAGMTGSRIAHPPELCFRAEGYTLTDSRTLELTPGLGVIRLRAVSDTAQLWIYYWFQLGGLTTESYLKHQLRALGERFRDPKPQRMYRITVEIDADDPAGTHAHERVLRFAREALPEILLADEVLKP
ncbi:MAG: exosortase-associated EpsI family protein, partial [Bdellovibrionota bacterium]